MRKETTLEDLAALEPNWDREGAAAIDPVCIARAREVKLQLRGFIMGPPSIVPTVTGGVQLEWHKHGLDLEVSIERRA